MQLIVISYWKQCIHEFKVRTIRSISNEGECNKRLLGRFFFYKLWGHLHFQEYLALLEKKRSVDFFPNLEKKPYNNESWNIKSHICIIEKLKGIPQSNCAKVAARGEHTECIGTHVRMLIDWLPKQWD